MSCICQQCNKEYKIDLLIPDNLWELIKPNGKEKGAGLLCGSCIINNLESLDQYGIIHGVVNLNNLKDE